MTTTEKTNPSPAPAGGEEVPLHRVCELFPAMDAQAFADLVADVKLHGLNEPIVRDVHGAVLDGRNRLAACREANVEPTFRTFEGSEQDAIAFVVSANLVRRHLSENQRCLIAAELANLKNGQRASAIAGGVSQEQAAKIAKVSSDQVARTQKVLKKGVPELVEAVKKDEVSVAAAAEVAELPPTTQQALVKEPGAVKKAAAKLREAKKAKASPKAATVPKAAATVPTPQPAPGKDKNEKPVPADVQRAVERIADALGTIPHSWWSDAQERGFLLAVDRSEGASKRGRRR